MNFVLSTHCALFGEVALMLLPRLRACVFTRSTILRLSCVRPVPVRWSSEDGNRGSDGQEKSDKRVGFFENFVTNLQQGLKRNKDMQESLKGLREERERMRKSYIFQRWKEQAGEGWERARERSRKGWEVAREVWRETRDRVGKTASEVSDSELGRKGSDLAQKTVERVSEQAEELRKTDVGQAVQKGASTVKEELLDDIIKHSAPYQPPERIQTRAEMSAAHASSVTHRENVIQPNEEAKEMVVTKQSTWHQRWQKLKEDNPLSNMLYSLRMKYDESDHLVVRGTRAVTDRVGDVFGSVMNQSDMAQALAEIKKIDRNFDKEEFIYHCRFTIIPTVLEAYVRGDLKVLKDWCHEAAFNVIAAVQRTEPGVTVDCRILEVRDTDIVMAKLMDPGPVLVLSFQAQQLTLKTKHGEESQDELLENVYYVWALCRDQTQYDPITAWKVLEFGIAAAGKMLV